MRRVSVACTDMLLLLLLLSIMEKEALADGDIDSKPELLPEAESEDKAETTGEELPEALS